MFCKNCGKVMTLDDVDFNFKGNKDNYYYCDCGVECIEEIRYNKQFKLKWFIGSSWYTKIINND